MNKISLRCFWNLIYHELYILKKDLISKLIDLFIVVFSNGVVFGYFFATMMPKSQNYGSFILVGILIIIGFFNVLTNVIELMFDLTGDKFISYKLLLPLPSFLVFSSIALGWALVSMLVNILMLPMAKLVLLGSFDLSNISMWRFIFIFFSAYIFFGYFALWLASIIKRLKRISILWLRVANPLFMFGGFFYTWYTAYNTSHIVGGINLLNPLIYAMEGTRAAVLGQQGFLPYWVCVVVLWVSTALCAWHSNAVLKKRLECV